MSTKKSATTSSRQFYRTNLHGLEVVEYGEEVPLSVLRYFFPYMDTKVRTLTHNERRARPR